MPEPVSTRQASVVNYANSYEKQLAQLLGSETRERAMELVVGGRYMETGLIERFALQTLGLQAGHCLVDVGCGSGRLANALSDYLTGRFIGTDILAEPLEYARAKCGRPDWEFIKTDRSTIPAPDGSADFVTFFSVFTHLLDEDVFRFLREARRVVKPTGRIVLSFLDFECSAHWPLFMNMVQNENPERVLNHFTTKAAIRRLARGAALREEAIYDGEQRWIATERPIVCEDGRELSGTIAFGHSIAVLSVFPDEAYLARYPDVRAAVAAGAFLSGAHHYETCGFSEKRQID